MSVSRGAGGRRGTTTFRDRAGARREGGGAGGEPIHSPFDPQTLQALISNAVRRGAARSEAADRITMEELLRRFALPDDDDRAQGAGRGATQELIDGRSSLRTIDAEESAGGLSENQSLCNICLEEFDRGDEVRKLTHCSHTFHKACIDRWLSRVASCPICKHELGSQQQ